MNIDSQPASPLHSWVRTHPVLTFYILAFTISWLGFAPLAAGRHGVVLFSNPLWQATLILMALGPALAAWIVGVSTRARDSAPHQLAAMYSVPVAWTWWIVAVFLPVAMFVIPNLLSHMLQPRHALAVAPASSLGILGATLYAVFANPWEEIGWRAFALRRLQQKHSVAVAASIVGVLWAAWHIPLFLWAPGALSMANVAYWPWAASILGRSFIMAWLFNRARQSLAIVTIFHISMNVSGAVFGVRSEPLLNATHIALAAILVVTQPQRFLERAPTRN